MFNAQKERDHQVSGPGIRLAAHAGRSYPAEPQFLARVTDALLDPVSSHWDNCPKAVIAPHGGYIYSGSITAKAFGPWKQFAPPVERVVLIGPSHLFDFPGIALPESSAFETPLGRLQVAGEVKNILRRYRFARVFEAAHLQEHTIEAVLPFVQRVFGSPSIIPLITGRADPSQISQLLDELWGGEETVLIVSSDLSHHLGYEAAQKMDAQTAHSIGQMEKARLTADQACGYQSIRGLLRSIPGREMRCVTADLRNSGDAADTLENVTGYGAFHFFEK